MNMKVVKCKKIFFYINPCFSFLSRLFQRIRLLHFSVPTLKPMKKFLAQYKFGENSAILAQVLIGHSIGLGQFLILTSLSVIYKISSSM